MLLWLLCCGPVRGDVHADLLRSKFRSRPQAIGAGQARRVTYADMLVKHTSKVAGVIGAETTDINTVRHGYSSCFGSGYR